MEQAEIKENLRRVKLQSRSTMMRETSLQERIRRTKKIKKTRRTRKTKRTRNLRRIRRRRRTETQVARSVTPLCQRMEQYLTLQVSKKKVRSKSEMEWILRPLLIFN